MIAIIDYGAGNLRSVANAFSHLGTGSRVITEPVHLSQADKIVLPGVGAFGAGMAALRTAGFEEPILEAAAQGVPLLGICLGLQYLFDYSDEMGTHRGLGLLPGYVTRFPRQATEDSGLKVPHIGWNRLQIRNGSPLTKGIPDGAYAYFVHSYFPVPAEDSDIIATTEYGIGFTAVAGRGNIFGIQCHPEKSQAVGLRILQNFIDL